MNLELRGKVVFVAGASRGIGFGIARGFLEEGAAVAITGRDPTVLAAAEQTLRSTMP
jgi:3-oxoacyl-[acyl-carrier protein] reductase